MPRKPITRANPYTPKGGAFAGETFHSERQYRNALARRKGFGSWYEQQRQAVVVSTAKEYSTLSAGARNATERALEAVSLMRNEGLSLTGAAKRVGTTPNTMHRYAGSALAKNEDGRWAAKASDRLFRKMRVLTTDGMSEVATRSSRTRSRVGRYFSAISHYLATGDDSRLAAFAGKRVGGKRLETDPAVIEEWARKGEIDFEDMYQHTSI